MTDDALLVSLLPQANAGEAFLKAVVGRLTGKASLLSVVEGELSEAVGLKALERLTDPASLAEAARRATHAACRIKALERLTDAEALAQALSGDGEASVRSAAALRLARFGDRPEAEPALREALSDPDADVRQAAEGALASIARWKQGDVTAFDDGLLSADDDSGDYDYDSSPD
jgi:hypothetical protein